MHDPEHSNENGAADSDWPMVHVPRSAGDHARQIRHDATTLAEEVRRTAADLEVFLGDRMRRQPYTTLSVAAGVGYMLGGGLATRFTIVMLGVATRVATALAIREIDERLHAQVSQKTAPTNETTA